MMASKNIHKKLRKKISKTEFDQMRMDGTDFDEISNIVKEEALRKRKSGRKSAKRGKKSCGCDA